MKTGDLVDESCPIGLPFAFCHLHGTASGRRFSGRDDIANCAAFIVAAGYVFGRTTAAGTSLESLVEAFHLCR